MIAIDELIALARGRAADRPITKGAGRQEPCASRSGSGSPTPKEDRPDGLLIANQRRVGEAPAARNALRERMEEPDSHDPRSGRGAPQPVLLGSHNQPHDVHTIQRYRWREATGGTQ